MAGSLLDSEFLSSSDILKMHKQILVLPEKTVTSGVDGQLAIRDSPHDPLLWAAGIEWLQTSQRQAQL